MTARTARTATPLIATPIAITPTVPIPPPVLPLLVPPVLPDVLPPVDPDASGLVPGETPLACGGKAVAVVGEAENPVTESELGMPLAIRVDANWPECGESGTV